jgi:hypothetical protein
LFLNE